jgi:hypothetical protein
VNQAATHPATAANDASETTASPPVAVATRPPTTLTRLGGLLTAAAGAAVLGVALWLTPDAAGIGTHTQIGWAPCGFEGRTGLPCATCGMTTATSLAAHGHLLTSLRVQPGGFLFALTCMLAVIAGFWSVWTGRSLTPVARFLAKPKALLTLGLLILLAWLYRLADAFAGHPWTTWS